MFEYSICNVADDEIFRKQCMVLEKNISPLTKAKLLEDVDGTLIQKYKSEDKEIKVCSDHFMDEVYVKSEIGLKQFFGQRKKNG